tara:strand:+ start:296 stop:598 length:303 start_codon:yes stop_codon:yes gene_type:complete
MQDTSNTFIVASQGAGYALKDREGDIVQAFQDAFDVEFNEDWTDGLSQVLLFTSKEEAEAACAEQQEGDFAFDWEVMSCFDYQQITGVDSLAERVYEDLN